VTLKESAEQKEGACPLCQLCWASLKERHPTLYQRWHQRVVAFREAVDKTKAPKSSGWETGVRVKGRFTFSINDQVSNDACATAKAAENKERLAVGGSLIAITPASEGFTPIAPTLGVFG